LDSLGLRRASPFLLVAALAVLVYAPTLSYGFAYDDLQLERSPLLADPWNFPALLANRFYPESLQAGRLYRPLSQWSLLLNGRASAGHAFLFHAVNVLLHAGACVLFFAWLARLGLSRAVALAAALLFAVHPIHVEAVANVSARSESMALLFGITFLILHRRGAHLAAALAYLLAMWSKESAVAFLPLALVADALFPGTAGGPWKRGILLYASTLALWFVLRAYALQGVEGTISFLDNPVAHAPAWVRVLTAARVQLAQLGALLAPVGVATDHSYAETVPVRSLLDPAALAFFVVLLAAAGAAWRLRRRNPVVGLCVLGYAILFSTTSNFLVPIGAIRAERLVYAPSAFACLLVAAGLAPLAARMPRVAVGTVLTAALVVLSWLTIAQSAPWKDSGTLFRDQVRTAPASAKAHLNLAHTLVDEGDLAGAVREYEASARIYPDNKWTWFFLGVAHERLGDPVRAIEAWRRALSLAPNLAEARARVIEALLGLGLRDQALTEWSALVDSGFLPPRFLELARRLWETSSGPEREAALRDLAEARELLARDQASPALERLARAERSGALRPEDLREVLGRIGDCHERLGHAAGARAFRRAAGALPP